MAALDPPGEAVAPGGLGHVPQRPVAEIEAFVDMQVEIERTLGGEAENVVQNVVYIGDHEDHRADKAARFADQVDDRVAFAVPVLLDHQQVDALNVDPAAPLLAQFAEHAPCRRRLPGRGLQMGADGARSVRVGAAEAELHPGAKVVGRPVGVAVVRHGLRGGAERAVGVPARGSRCGRCPRWVWMSAKQGQTCPPSRSRSPGSTFPAGRRMPAMRPSAMEMSTFASPSASTSRSASESAIRARGARAVPQCKCRHGRHFRMPR